MKTKTCVATLAVLALSACGFADDMNELVLKAIEDAKTVDDPWQAHEQLTNTFKAIEKKRCNELGCGPTPSELGEKVRSELVRYENSAVSNGDPSAIAYVYRNGNTEQISELIPTILSAANKAHGNSEDRVVLRVAGLIVSEGRFALKNTNIAMGYFSRAWAAGEVEAANDAAVLYQSIHDYRNAYLWSLRCISPCIRRQEVRLDKLQAFLGDAAAKQAQTAAGDASVVSLDTQE